MIKIQKLGGHGVDIKLTSFETTDSVFWSACKNSYVVVETERGQLELDGIRVSLVSINGIGEVRWTVSAAMLSYDEEGILAARHFGLLN